MSCLICGGKVTTTAYALRDGTPLCSQRCLSHILAVSDEHAATPTLDVPLSMREALGWSPELISDFIETGF